MSGWGVSWMVAVLGGLSSRRPGSSVARPTYCDWYQVWLWVVRVDCCVLGRSIRWHLAPLLARCDRKRVTLRCLGSLLWTRDADIDGIAGGVVPDGIRRARCCGCLSSLVGVLFESCSVASSWPLVAWMNAGGLASSDRNEGPSQRGDGAVS